MRQQLLVSAFSAAVLAVIVYVFAPDVVTIGTSARITLALLGGLVGALVAYAAYAQRTTP